MANDVIDLSPSLTSTTFGRNGFKKKNKLLKNNHVLLTMRFVSMIKTQGTFMDVIEAMEANEGVNYHNTAKNICIIHYQF